MTASSSIGIGFGAHVEEEFAVFDADRRGGGRAREAVGADEVDGGDLEGVAERG